MFIIVDVRMNTLVSQSDKRWLDECFVGIVGRRGVGAVGGCVALTYLGRLVVLFG